MAKTKGLGDAMEENLFRAHFIDGLDVGNNEVLAEIGKKSGLTETDVEEALKNEDYAYRANQDILEARNIGVSGVPFFVFNKKYAISGAQPVDVFINTLDKSFTEWQKENPPIKLQVSKGPACQPGGICD